MSEKELKPDLGVGNTFQGELQRPFDGELAEHQKRNELKGPEADLPVATEAVRGIDPSKSVETQSIIDSHSRDVALEAPNSNQLLLDALNGEGIHLEDASEIQNQAFEAANKPEIK